MPSLGTFVSPWRPLGMSDKAKAPYVRRALWGLGTLLTAILLLLIFDLRVLIFEKRVHPGQNFVVAEWGDIGKAEQAQLVCRYFTGRSIKTRVFWYSPNNIMGRDQCAFIERVAD